MAEIPNAEPIKILLVEDNPADARLAVEALEESRVRSKLYHVDDGVQAMNFLHRQNEFRDAPLPDLILLDLNLPRKDGREVLEEIKGDPKLKMIPVIVLTTSAAERDLVKTYHLHANAYIVKPLDYDEFGEVVRAIDAFWFSVARLPQMDHRKDPQ